jgi:hypothetical protein
VAVEAGNAQFNDGLHYLFYWLARAVTPTHAAPIATAVTAVGLGLVVLALLRERSDDMVRPVGVLLAAYVLLTASVAPWYTLWVLPFVALCALPRLGTGQGWGVWAGIFGSYWLLFSWTAGFSELYYVVDTPLWRVVHVLEYALPAGALLATWLLGKPSYAARTAPPEKGVVEF